MESNNRITFYIVIVTVLALSFMPCVFAQGGFGGGGRGGMGGMGGGIDGPPRGDSQRGNSGDTPFTGPDSMNRGGGPGGRGGRDFGIQSLDELTDEQLDRILKNYSSRNPTKAKELEGLRKTNKERFLSELSFNAFYEVATEMREERERNEILVFLKQYSLDEYEEVLKVKEEEGFDRYDQILRLGVDSKRNKYRSIIDAFPPLSEELIPVLVEDLNLRNELTELARSYMSTPDSQTEAKEKMKARIIEILRKRYELELKQREIALKQVELDLINAQNMYDAKKEQLANDSTDEVINEEVQKDFDALIYPYWRRGFGGDRRGRSGGLSGGRPGSGRQGGFSEGERTTVDSNNN